ncbi:aminodeoxychorismate lyase [Atopomonas sediminilitoris]|uniref:aminodeoxychorismate lyase n=1 Tax=Atopomonas sediminilitoris TaxID=2919919 RepID=UPI001F4D7671|nr:aminodeoxychorismate lyase [Atopomonas sediminilitoris]MCJ8167787.1 aminodeoxychorismate lyase [Atopomonas sediminilitoris]
MSLIWVNGQPQTTVSVVDRGLAYGDGLFETIRVQQGQMPLLALHCARLEAGCQRLLIPLDLALVQAELRAFAQTLQMGVIKLMVTRGDGMRGYAPPEPSSPRRIVQSANLPQYPAEHAERGVSLFACQTRLALQPALAGLKHLNRLEQVLARSEWRDPQYAEGLMRDSDGWVIEGVFSNLFIVRDGCLYTPELNQCGVAGIMRQALLSQAPQRGLTVKVAPISYDALLAADEVLLCNSLYGVWPVRTLCDRTWPVGPVTRKLQALAQELMVV